MYKALIIVLLLLAVPALGQTPGDINCNGFAYEVADAVIAAQLLIGSCQYDSIATCTLENGDIDGDHLGLTIGDYLFLVYHQDSIPDYPDYPHNPLSDTLMLASGRAYPGQTLTLPLELITADTIVALEFYLAPQTQDIAIDSLIPESEIHIVQQYCRGNLFGCTLPTYELDVLLPGAYQLGNLVVTVNPDIDHQVTTSIVFSSDPDHIFYTGLANFGFFTPVTVNSTITISPAGIAEDSGILPDQISLKAYPNPFNSSTTIFVNGMSRAEIGIFDLTGRRIALLDAEDGKAVWDAAGFSSGIYFAKLMSEDNAKTIRLTFLK